MSTWRKVNFRSVFVFVVLVGAIALGAVANTSESGAVEPDLASVARGGRLYDNWIEELRASKPLVVHPSYPKAGKYVKDAAATWRCKECHGWDYLGRDGAYGLGKHFTNIIGIQGIVGTAPEKIITILRDKTHGYGDVLFGQELRDLANFVSSGQVKMDRVVSRANKKARADPQKGKVYFKTICANCHGADGQKFRHLPSLGNIASLNPWESFHKILNGHPGESMPALRAFDHDILIGILAYTQTLPKEDTLASIVRGGRLYDNWYAEARKPKPLTPHPAYPKMGKAAKYADITWRCKECHGWDYRGDTGVYGKGIHYTGIQGIWRAAGKSTDKIIKIMSNATHGYSTKLAYRDLRDLANFVSKGQVDMDRYIDRETGASKGDRNKHVAYYTTICATCHGTRGTKIITMEPLGHVAVNNPWAALHMLLNGHPAEEMPALRVLEINVLVDVLTYLQSLPTKR